MLSYISSPSRDSHYAQTHTGHREIVYDSHGLLNGGAAARKSQSGVTPALLESKSLSNLVSHLHVQHVTTHRAARLAHVAHTAQCRRPQRQVHVMPWLSTVSIGNTSNASLLRRPKPLTRQPSHRHATTPRRRARVPIPCHHGTPAHGTTHTPRPLRCHTRHVHNLPLPGGALASSIALVEAHEFKYPSTAGGRCA